MKLLPILLLLSICLLTTAYGTGKVTKDKPIEVENEDASVEGKPKKLKLNPMSSKKLKKPQEEEISADDEPKESQSKKTNQGKKAKSAKEDTIEVDENKLLTEKFQLVRSRSNDSYAQSRYDEIKDSVLRMLQGGKQAAQFEEHNVKIDEEIVREKPKGLAKTKSKKPVSRPVESEEDEDDDIDEEEETTSSKKGTMDKWTVCTGKASPLDCQCEGTSLNCNKIKPTKKIGLDTTNIQIKGDRKIVDANFNDNIIHRLYKNKIVPGQEDTIEKLSFNSNRISIIEDEAFAPFKNLKKLDLSNNLIGGLKWKFFKGMDNLHCLNLSYNLIRKVPPNVFAEYLPNIKELVLDGNPIVNFTKEMFKGLDSLQTLSLDNCSIDSLPDNVFDNMPNLKQVSLIGNTFTVLPKAVNGLKMLTDLDVSESYISEFQSFALKDNQNLKKLSMRSMPFLSNIESCAFCGLASLEQVDMSESKVLFSINENAFGQAEGSESRVTTLIQLYVENCNLTTISEALCDWDQLQELQISGNPLSCDCDTSFLLEGQQFSSTSHKMPECSSPPKFAGKSLTKLKVGDVCDEKVTRLEKTKSLSSLGVMLLVIFCGFGIYLAISRGLHKKLFVQVQNAPVAYSNLTNRDDQQTLEQDFQPRAQEMNLEDTSEPDILPNDCDVMLTEVRVQRPATPIPVNEIER